MTNLTDDEREALRIMREIVAEKGADYVYPDSEKRLDSLCSEPICQYARYDEDGNVVAPSCIVGHYLTRTGVSLGDLSIHEGTAAIQVVPFSPGSRLAEAFNRAQEAQDDGLTWGEALRAFEERLGVSA